MSGTGTVFPDPTQSNLSPPAPAVQPTAPPARQAGRQAGRQMIEADHGFQLQKIHSGLRSLDKHYPPILLAHLSVRACHSPSDRRTTLDSHSETTPGLGGGLRCHDADIEPRCCCRDRCQQALARLVAHPSPVHRPPASAPSPPGAGWFTVSAGHAGVAARCTGTAAPPSRAPRGSCAESAGWTGCWDPG